MSTPRHYYWIKIDNLRAKPCISTCNKFSIYVRKFIQYLFKKNNSIVISYSEIQSVSIYTPIHTYRHTCGDTYTPYLGK